MQTLNYMERQISLNRAQAKVDSDGNFEMVVAHQNPGVDNWLDTEGRRRGVIFCRFQLVQGEIKPLAAEVVKFKDLS